MRTLPQNPYTRKPYSDVNGELSVHVGDVFSMFVGLCERKQPPMTCDERSDVNRKLLSAQRALLRAKAALDPEAMTEQDWEDAKQTAHGLAVELAEREIPEEDTPQGRVARFLNWQGGR